MAQHTIEIFEHSGCMGYRFIRRIPGNQRLCRKE